MTYLANCKQKSKLIRTKYPFYAWACDNVDGYKTLEGNIAYRKYCIEKSVKDKEFAHKQWIMCSRDMLYWLNTYGFTYDPRLKLSKKIPFITYMFQDVSLDDVKIAIEEGDDELTEKSRDMGASWMYLSVFTWMWQFRHFNTFRMLSRNEDLVDNADNTDSLFWKVMFLVDSQPGFLKPNFKKVHLNLTNHDNGSTITGCSTTSDAARGGRCTAMLLDEFAAVPDGWGMLSATRDVTTCRLFNSTHKGAGTAFYALSRGTIKKLITHWSLHPVKAKGLYYADKQGKLVMLDDFTGQVKVNGEKYDYPDYPFRLDGKLRSPWYDNECDRAAHPMEIAQELDMDPFASDFQYFEGEMIGQIEKEDIRPPYLEGMLEFDEDSLDPIEFRKGEGPLKLWINLDAYGKLPFDLEVAVGIDISAGTGASNSTASFVNIRTGEKIAEYATPLIKPEAFAKVAIALCKFFNDAFMIPDGAGAGRIFCDTVIECGYRNLYYRRNEEGLKKKVSDKPGVFLNPKEKTATLGQYRKSLKDKTFIQRSHEANQECLAYVFTVGNTIEHSASVNSIDPSGAKDNHGDRVIADALAAKAIKFLGKNNTKSGSSAPKNCYAARRQEYEKRQKEKNQW